MLEKRAERLAFDVERRPDTRRPRPIRPEGWHLSAGHASGTNNQLRARPRRRHVLGAGDVAGPASHFDDSGADANAQRGLTDAHLELRADISHHAEGRAHFQGTG